MAGDVTISRRERQVLDELVTSGGANHEIANALGIRPGTVKANISKLLAKTGSRNRTQLATWWKDNGWWYAL